MLLSKILSSSPKHFDTAWDSTAKTEKTLINLTTRLLTEEAKSKNNEAGDRNLAFSVVCSNWKIIGHKAKNYKKRSFYIYKYFISYFLWVAKSCYLLSQLHTAPATPLEACHELILYIIMSKSPFYTVKILWIYPVNQFDIFPMLYDGLEIILVA